MAAIYKRVAQAVIMSALDEIIFETENDAGMIDKRTEIAQKEAQTRWSKTASNKTT